MLYAMGDHGLIGVGWSMQQLEHLRGEGDKSEKDLCAGLLGYMAFRCGLCCCVGHQCLYAEGVGAQCEDGHS